MKAVLLVIYVHIPRPRKAEATDGGRDRITLGQNPKKSYVALTSCLNQGQREPPIEVSISGKSMVGFEGLCVQDNF